MNKNIILLTIIILIVFLILVYRNNFNLFSNTNKIILSDKLSKEEEGQQRELT